jgi:bifunctional non-homologous end joining protein LigD
MSKDNDKVIITQPEKIIYPEDQITKQMVVEYYNKIAPKMFELNKNHILSMQRFPEGINKEGFWHKNCPDFFPKWIKRYKTIKEDKEEISYIVISKPEIFPFVANYYSVVNHIWTSTYLKPHHPDRVIFDLDPSLQNDFAKVQKVAIVMHEQLNKLKLNNFVMTTGSRGLHVVLPVKEIYTHAQIKIFAQNFADYIVNLIPNIATTNIRKEKREDKIFIDILRNNYAQTAVAPYSLRAIENAPIATPINWQEVLKADLSASKYTIFDLNKIKDKKPWQNFYKLKNYLIK